MEKVKDEMFSKGMMGFGCAIYPDKREIYSPIDGRITMVFPGGHALGIHGDDGKEVLLHIGIDTVKLKGKGFQLHTVAGQQVRQGDLLVEADIAYIKEQGYDPSVICVITEPKATAMVITATGKVGRKDVVMK